MLKVLLKDEFGDTALVYVHEVYIDEDDKEQFCIVLRGINSDYILKLSSKYDCESLLMRLFNSSFYDLTSYGNCKEE